MSEATNDVEKLLISAQAGELDQQSFMTALLDSEVFMPVRDKYQIAGLQLQEDTQPLTIKDEESDAETLVIFTSPERAREFVSQHPGYGGGLLAEFKWVVDQIGVGVPITINPGDDLGVDLNSGMFNQGTTH